MRDTYNKTKVTRALSPTNGGNDTALVSQIIDTLGYDSLLFAIATGSLADSNATFTVLVEDGDSATLTDNAAVDDSQLLGTESGASFTYADDNKAIKIGYYGTKRYVRLTITPSGNTGDDYISALAIQGCAKTIPYTTQKG